MPRSAPRVALVTGASSGIGLSFARRLARQGTDVVLVARRRDRLDALAAEIVTSGRRAWTIAADLADPSAVDGVLAHVRSREIPVDLLVNNAGFGAYGTTLGTSLTTLRSMVRLNVEALTSLAWELGTDMISRGGGSIVNVASTAAFQPVPYFGPYAATKAFVLSFSEALRVELAPAVNVICLCPGMTDTEFHGVARLGRHLMKFPSMSADEVADIGMRAVLDGSGVVVAGLGNRLVSWLARNLPRALVLSVTTRLFRGSGEYAAKPGSRT